jgi:hypothetical protein
VALFAASLTRTKACAVAALGTLQLNIPPDAPVEELMAFHVLPLSGEYSIFTFEIFVCVHVMVCDVPTIQFSPPFGDVTETAAMDAARVEKLWALLYELVPPEFFAFTLQ